MILPNTFSHINQFQAKVLKCYKLSKLVCYIKAIFIGDALVTHKGHTKVSLQKQYTIYYLDTVHKFIIR